MIVEIQKRCRKVGFRFDALAAFLLCEQYGVDLNTMDDIPRDEYVVSWCWSAHRSYCLKGYKKARNLAQMRKFINGLRKTEWDSIVRAMTDARGEGGDDKKKVQHGGNSSSQDGRSD